MTQLFPDLEPPAPKPESLETAPLAAQLAPKTFADYVGQSHLIAEGKPLRRAIENDILMSLILWGGPGVGKTALARLMARHSNAKWIALNAVMSKVQDVREAIESAKANRQLGHKTVLFIDEIHRFNKSQQDALLPDVEKGTVILIGATTENPFFAVNSAIISRCQLYELYPLNEVERKTLILNALNHPKLAHLSPLNAEVLSHINRQSHGDGRRIINILEMLAISTPNGTAATIKTVEDILQQKGTLYRDDEHYDIISAFIKSVRGSDANAALYWLARMIRGGEDPKFIARRLLILASEDIGLADKDALNIAVNGVQTVQYIGWPEARITLSQVTIYLAQAPKSNTAYKAINEALAYVDAGNIHEVPVHVRSKVKPKDPNKPDTKYIYTHDHPEKSQKFWDGTTLFLI